MSATAHKLTSVRFGKFASYAPRGISRHLFYLERLWRTFKLHFIDLSLRLLVSGLAMGRKTLCSAAPTCSHRLRHIYPPSSNYIPRGSLYVRFGAIVPPLGLLEPILQPKPTQQLPSYTRLISKWALLMRDYELISVDIATSDLTHTNEVKQGL